MLIEQIDLKYDLKQLKTDLDAVTTRFSFNEHGQMCLNYPDFIKDSYQQLYFGTGSIFGKLSPKGEPVKETDFTDFNVWFMGTVFQDIYEDLSERYTMGRFRLMRLKPKSTYTMHQDFDPLPYRIHVTLKNDEDAFFVHRTADGQHVVSQIPWDGHCYKFNTEIYHTAVNTSLNDRIHLVAVVAPKE